MTVPEPVQEDAPTTEEVRLGYALSKDDRDMRRYRYDHEGAEAEWERTRDAAYVEFDRWLAGVRADAWVEGFSEGKTGIRRSDARNPYREGTRDA